MRSVDLYFLCTTAGTFQSSAGLVSVAPNTVDVIVDTLVAPGSWAICMTMLDSPTPEVTRSLLGITIRLCFLFVPPTFSPFPSPPQVGMVAHAHPALPFSQSK